MGFIFGLLGFVFVLSAMEKIRRLEQRLKDAGGLKETNDSGCEYFTQTLGAHTGNQHTSKPMMARTFEFDVLQCPRCGGRMKIIAAIESPEVARRILDCLGIVSRPPSLLPARRQIVQLDSAEADFLV